jgi:hypothetical protein
MRMAVEAGDGDRAWAWPHARASRKMVCGVVWCCVVFSVVKLCQGGVKCLCCGSSLVVPVGSKGSTGVSRMATGLPTM